MSIYGILCRKKNALYAKPDFSDEDGLKAAELEEEFADMDGWNAESDAATLVKQSGNKRRISLYFNERYEWKTKSKGFTCPGSFWKT